MSILEIKNLYKKYEDDKLGIEILKDISLNIDKGEFVVITGPSGSGKTTLLNCMSGLEKITKGNVIIDGKDIVGIKPKEMSTLRKHKIGFVFQAFNLLPNLTVYENIAISSIIAGNENKERILELLDKFGLKEYKNYFPNQISGGMQQRTAIVRSLINDPEIIFADEPTGNLDSKSSIDVMENFAYLHKEFNKTIVMVTHSLDQIKYASRHIQIIDGKVISDLEVND